MRSLQLSLNAKVKSAPKNVDEGRAFHLHHVRGDGSLARP